MNYKQMIIDILNLLHDDSLKRLYNLAEYLYIHY